MTLTIDIPDPPPKRGDLLQTNVGNRRERTCFILKVKPLKPRIDLPRFKLTVIRWWEIEPGFRSLLFRHADRHGGQRVILFARYPVRKKKLTFEQYMKRPVRRR